MSPRLAVGTGAALGALLALVVFAPASWLAGRVASATGQRLLLADARGTVWQGSAVLVLTGGADSRDAAALPGRLQWRIGLAGMKLAVGARHECCLNGELQLLIEPGIGQVRLTLPPADGIRGQWPASWLAGLGTPWNTLQLGGWMKLASPGLTAEIVQGRFRLNGSAELQLDDVSSRLSTLPRLGSYRIGIAGAGDGGSGGGAGISMATIEGPLLLSGSGQWSTGGVRFRGEARADQGAETVLNNLLNLIGRRQGALSVISIG